MFKVPEHLRVRTGPNRTDKSHGCNGEFSLSHSQLPLSIQRKIAAQNVLPCMITITASDKKGVEHVKVVINRPRFPIHEEMAYIKSIFWDQSDTVLQMYPSEPFYTPNEEQVLHLWKRVGIKEAEEIHSIMNKNRELI